MADQYNTEHRDSEHRDTDHSDIDAILRKWKFESGELSARMIEAGDGRDVIQMRIDMGVLQFEVSRRPDGRQPGGAETYFDLLLSMAIHSGDDFVLTEEQCTEVDREFVQFYQRRLCWLALREFDRAVGDADHSLSLMDFVRDHSPDKEWTMSHEQYRPFIVFQRAQAAALGELEQSRPEAAIAQVDEGINLLREFFAEEGLGEHSDEDELVGQLVELKDSLRDRYSVDRSLTERLADAIAAEDYELAALLRDEIGQHDPKTA